MRTRIFALLTILSIGTNVEAYFQDKALRALARAEGKTYLEILIDDLDYRIKEIQADRHHPYRDIFILGNRLRQLREAKKEAEKNEGIDEATQEKIDTIIETTNWIFADIDGRV